MSDYAILLGGDLKVTERLRSQLSGRRIIAADSGIRHARALGVEPELWVGDFDSSDAALRTEFAHVARASFPPAKDKTDGELAVDTALERGARSLLLAGAFGGMRADHAFLHMTLAIRLCEAGVPVVLTSGSEEGWPILAGTRTDCRFPVASVFSVLPFSDLSALTLEGAQWPLGRADVPFGSSLTLSNAVAGPLRVSLGRGRALLLVHLEAR